MPVASVGKGLGKNDFKNQNHSSDMWLEI